MANAGLGGEVRVIEQAVNESSEKEIQELAELQLALAGGGIHGGQVIGSSDKIGGYPKDAKVTPQDLTATIFHCLGYAPDTEIRDNLNRPIPISRGDVIRGAVG